MRRLTEFLGVKLSAADLRRLEMIVQLQRVSKSRFARDAIAEAVRQGFVSEVEHSLPRPASCLPASHLGRSHDDAAT